MRKSEENYMKGKATTITPLKPFDPEAVASELGIYWFSNSDAFYMQDHLGRWHRWKELNVVEAMMALPGREIGIRARHGEKLAEATVVLLWVRRNRAVLTLEELLAL